MTPPTRALMPILAALGDWLHQNDAELEERQRSATLEIADDEASTS
jgi:hypothetical protein